MRNQRIALLLIALAATLAQAQIPVTDDAFTSSTAPTANYGTSLGLVVQSPTASGSMVNPAEASGYTANTYLKFDLSALASNVTAGNLAKANLRLYVDFVVSSGTFDIYLAGGSWTEGTLTAGNAPGKIGTPINSSPISVNKALKYIDIDITEGAAAWLNGMANNGLVLVPTTGSNIFVSFDSKENPLTAHDPQLSVSVNDASSLQLQQEINRATQAENTIATNLSTETIRAEGVEGGLSQALNTEIGRAKAAEGGLSGGLGAEITNRMNGDTATLNSAKAYTDTSVGGEVILRTTADNQLQGNITALHNSLTNYAQLGTANQFTASQTISGDLSANNINAAGELTAAGGALLPPTQTATPAQGSPSNPFDIAASVSDGNTAHNETFRWQAAPVNNGTPNFAAQLNLLYGGGVTPSPTILSINSDGTQNFAANQIFNGQHSGDGSGLRNVTAVSANTANSAIFATNAGSAAMATSAMNFTGSMSGDVTGSQSSTMVTGLQGVPLSRSPPQDGQVLGYSAAARQWQPVAATAVGPGPAVAAAPPTPPSPYAGTFVLQTPVGAGQESVRLTSFAGCYDKVLGVVYEDCYFQIDHFSQAVMQWLNDTVNSTGSPVLRNLTVNQLDSTGSVIASVQVGQAFLRDFSISDADGVSTATGTLSFVAVPASLTMAGAAALAPQQAASVQPPPIWKVNAFAFVAQNVDGSRVTAVRGMHMSVPKLAAPSAGSRLQFQAGTPNFDDIRVTFADRGQTATDLQAWAGNIAQGNIDQRTGYIQFQGNVNTLATLQFNALLPVSLTPFGTGLIGSQLTIDLMVGSFSFQ